MNASPTAAIVRLGIALLLVTAVAAPRASALPDDRFLGGGGDGAAEAGYTGFAPPAAGDLKRHVGGGGDGYSGAAVQGYTPPAPGEFARFLSGGRDGYGSGFFAGYTPPVAGQFARFLSGGRDGYGSGFFAGYTPPVAGQFARHLGGGYDGYTSAQFEGYTPPVPGQYARYLGGGYDGHDADAIEGVPNPLDGDVDGDDVPDWWESGHYRSVTLAGKHTDIDGDGLGSYHEWKADTDPMDLFSTFVIITWQAGATIDVDCATTSVDREYWLEYSTTLAPGSWTPITAPRVPGNGGMKQFTAPHPGVDTSFFRVRVDFPQ